MGLTIQTAQQAAQIAQQAVALQAAIAAIQSAFSNPSTQINSVVATTTSGAQLVANIQLSAPDSVAMLNAMLGIYQSMLNTMIAQLAAM